MKARLTWSDENYGVQGFNVYRDTQALDPDALPEPLAVLGPSARSYEDETIVEGETYYYVVAALVDGTEPATANFEILAEEPDEVPVYEVFEATGTGATGTIQQWTAPNTGLFTIEAYGAQGGGSQGGLGARLRGTFQLTAGDTLDVLVGQQGLTESVRGSGGGGSFVAFSGAADVQGLLVAAGGGGGSFNTNHNARHGSVLPEGNPGASSNPSYWGSGGVEGGGGNAGYRTGGGGGFLSEGDTSNDNPGGIGGAAFLTGGEGGAGLTPGAFGGGGGVEGGASAWRYHSGGGGYSGGGGGSGSNSTSASGGGGGSLNAGTDQDNEAGVREGNGLVIIYNASGLAART